MKSSIPSSQLSRGYAAALGAALLLSTTAIFIRALTQNTTITPLVLAFWRDSFVVLTLLPVLGGLRPTLLRLSQKSHWLYLAGYGAVLALFNALWTFSVALNGAAVSTVLVYTSVAFTAVLGWWLLKESFGWGKLLAILASLGGCVLIADAFNPAAWQSNGAGIVVGMLAGLSYALYSLMGRSAAQRGLNPWTTLLYTFGFAGLFLLLLNLVGGGWLPGAAALPQDLFSLGSAWASWGILFLLAAGPTVLGFGLYNVSLSHLPSSVANLIVTLEPVFTAVTAYALLGERLSGAQIGGSLLILAAVLILRLAGKAPALSWLKSLKTVWRSSFSR